MSHLIDTANEVLAPYGRYIAAVEGNEKGFRFGIGYKGRKPSFGLTTAAEVLDFCKHVVSTNPDRRFIDAAAAFFAGRAMKIKEAEGDFRFVVTSQGRPVAALPDEIAVIGYMHDTRRERDDAELLAAAEAAAVEAAKVNGNIRFLANCQ